MADLEHRVTVLETKIEVMDDKLLKHEERTEKLFEKIASTLDEIRDEIQNFRIGSITVDNKINSLVDKGNTIWKTISIVAGGLSITITAVYHIIKDFM